MVFKKQLAKLLPSSAPAPSKRNYREEGDRFRDAGEFAEAADAYDAHLTDNPDDFDIWVQRGNCLKDSGSHAAAKMAYERAINVRPDDADVYLQLGHLLKIQNKHDDAIGFYKKSYVLDQKLGTLRELMNLGEDTDDLVGTSASAKQRVFLEVTDLFNYLRAHPTLSGIQRVQVGLCQFMATYPCEDFNTFFVVSTTNKKFESILKAVDPDALMALFSFVAKRSDDHRSIISKVNELDANGIIVDARKNDIYFVLGSFWGIGGAVDRYLSKKRSGVKIGVYIYDIIPLSHPEYCDEGLSQDFKLALGDGLAIFDFILTISEFTAQEIKKLISDCGLSPLPIKAIPLAHSLTGKYTKNKQDFRKIEKFEAFAEEKFVLYVSTIEGRKNHHFVVSAWRELLRQGIDVPHLVFVGRPGWRVDGLFAELDATDYLGKRVHLVHDLSDMELNVLYQNCLFTVFTSFVEGWGLPVGESLVNGRLCVASNTSSIPEVGGEFVEYVHPQDLAGGISTFKKLLQSPDLLKSKENHIRTSFKARDWGDVGADFVRALRELAFPLKQGTNSIRWPLVGINERVHFSDYTRGKKVVDSYISNPMRLSLGASFYPPENFGACLRGSSGNLTFRSSLATAVEATIILETIAGPNTENCSFRIWVDGNAAEKEKVRLLKKSSTFVVLKGAVGPGSIMTVNFKIIGKTSSSNDESRSFGLGIVSFIHCQASDLLARIEMLEHLL
jgi:glycosyltransferase involved in cell wall biosynthesis